MELDHADVRRLSGISCVPGRDTRSGGLTIDAVERVARLHGVAIDFGRTPDSPGVRRWPEAEVRRRLAGDFACTALGDYGSLPVSERARDFTGDHSMVGRNLDEARNIVRVGDPLRGAWVWMAWPVFWRYVTTFANATYPGALAGFVRMAAVVPPPDTSTNPEDPAVPSTTVTLYPAGATLRTREATRAFKWDGRQIVARRDFTGPTGAAADARVEIDNGGQPPTGSYIRIASGAYSGYLLPGGVTDVVEVAPVDCSAVEQERDAARAEAASYKDRLARIHGLSAV